MANKKISELTSRTPALSDLILVGDPSSGYSYKCTVTALATIIETDIADGFVTIGTTQTISGAKTFSNNLTLTSVANATTTQTKFLTLNGSNVVNYRTGAEVLADIGGQGSITLTTLGTGGVATLVGNTLNIPQYQGALTNPVTGTGTTNYVTKWTSLSTIGNSQIIDNGTAVGIGTAASNAYKLSVAGIYRGVGVGNAARIELYDTQSGGATFYISPQESLGVTSLGTYGAFPILFVTNSAERIRISSAGDVTISTIANATTDTDKFLVSDSGVIKYRTGAEVLSDIGGQAALTNPVTGTGTTNYIPKFTSSSAIGNSVIYESGGSIGIGTTTPIGLLHIASSGNTFSIIDGGASSNTGVSFYKGGSAAGAIYYLGASDAMRFDVVNAERMRLDASGNLGLGTSSPSAKLDVLGNVRVGGSGNPSLTISGTDGAYTGLFYINAAGGGSSKIYANGGSNTLILGTNSTDRVTLDASGNLGLGVTPSAWSLSTAFDIANGPSILGYGNETYFTNNVYFASGGWKYRANASAQAYWMQGGQHSWHIAGSGTAGNAISFTQAMTLDASGRLGIGVTNPSARLAVHKSESGAGAGAVLRLENTGSYYTSTMILTDGTTNDALISYLGATQSLGFGVGATANKMVITSGGNVGIGTTTPGSKLSVVGLPTSSTGLSAGDIWNDSGTLKIV